MFLCRWIILSLFFFTFGVSTAQNLNCKRFPVGVAVEIDTLLIEPSSISSPADFKYDPESRKITILSSTLDSALVCYRRISSYFIEPIFNRSLSTYDDAIFKNESSIAIQPVAKTELFDFPGIEKYGSITRGVTFGNRQNLFVNANLNLQLDGQLDDNLFISAVITDQNIPYQPEGNTQQIRDFDNVFIKLYNDDFEVIAGDIVLEEKEKSGYFMRYLKNIQGLQAQVIKANDKLRSTTRVSGAIAKGKFYSAQIDPIDGVSGPYKLRGPQGERFIVVLANSEKVFLDGRLLKRGFDEDYIIDYNLGEIIFSNGIVITQFSIIRVDFEYAEQNYGRSNVSVSQIIENEKLSMHVDFYRERDNPSAELGFTLSDQDLQNLQLLGDQDALGFISSLDTSSFNVNQIQYVQIDSIDQDGTLQRIFVFSGQSEEQFFSPSFTEVGEGNGDYILLNASANGRVYQWVSPVNGVSQGRFTPGSSLTLPTSRQLFSVGGSAQLSAFENISFDIALSDTDQNLYSDIDDDDNIGSGYFLKIQSSDRPSFIKDYKMLGSLAIEFDRENFTFIDRYRPILFDRDWGSAANLVENTSSDLIIKSQLGLRKNEANKVLYDANRRLRGTEIDGWFQQLALYQATGLFRFQSDHSYLQNSRGELEDIWIRSFSDFRFKKWSVQPGVALKIDKSQILQEDSIAASLMNFEAQEFYLASSDSSNANYRISYEHRRDFLPQSGILQEYLQSHNVSASYQLKLPNGSLGGNVNYRKVNDRLEVNDIEDEILNGRINWIQNFFQGNIRNNFSFATGNSRELQREFVYLPVNAGQGTHTWRDLNEDGVQDLNEFFEAINPDERNFAKIFTPTDTYTSAFQTFYLHSIDASFPTKWQRIPGIKSFLGKMSLNINFNTNFRTASTRLDQRLNPFSISVLDEDALSVQDNKRYTAFYNRNRRGFSADLTLQTSDIKQLLSQGFELREREVWTANAKLDLGSDYTFRATSSIATLLNQSDFLISRNFNIWTQTYTPQLIWLPTRDLRVVGSYEYKNNNNRLAESMRESSRLRTLKGELTYNRPGSGSLRSTLSFVNIDFEGDVNSYLAYLLLDALQPGRNQTWQFAWQQKIGRGMQLSLLYNGRKSENQSAIHTGTVELTAFF